MRTIEAILENQVSRNDVELHLHGAGESNASRA
jgi:hypothetical protein